MPPKIYFTEEQVQKAYELGTIHCTMEEIASILNCSVDTLERNPGIADAIKRGKEAGKESLRRLQIHKATGRPHEYERNPDGSLMLDQKKRPIIKKMGYAPDTTMLIWLGKQLLNQRDDRILALEDKGNTRFKVSIEYIDANTGETTPLLPEARAAAAIDTSQE